ncbi:MAG: TonB family protein [Sulfurimonadaceae bacterium]
MLCVKLCTISQSKEIAEKKEIKEPKAVLKEKQIEPKKVKKAEIQKEIVEKTIEVADEVFDLKFPFIGQAKEEVIVDAVPAETNVKEKEVVEKELNDASVEQKIDDVALIQKAWQEEYLEINMQKIAQLLEENLYYPMSARKRNITGLVKVSFTLDTDAKVDNIKIIESESDILSRAAIKTIQDLSAKFPKPTKELTLSVPINYNLN